MSVVFAAASLEAFLNEAAYLAVIKNSLRAPQPPVVLAFAQVMEEAEESRVQILSKVQLGSLVLAGKTYDRGTAPYQDFADLIAVRNLLMHGKADERFVNVDGELRVLNPAAVLDRLASKNILHDAPPEHKKGFVAVAGEPFMVDLFLLEDLGDIPDKSNENRMMTRWTYLIGTKAVAEWACNTASRIALDLMEKAPSGRWKEIMEAQFRKVFSAPLE